MLFIWYVSCQFKVVIVIQYAIYFLPHSIKYPTVKFWWEFIKNQHVYK